MTRSEKEAGIIEAIEKIFLLNDVLIDILYGIICKS